MIQRLITWRLDCLLLVLAAIWSTVTIRNRTHGIFLASQVVRAIFLGWVFVFAGLGLIEWAGSHQAASIQQMMTGYAPSYAVMLESAGIEKITPQTQADDPVYLRLIDLQKRLLQVNVRVNDIYTFVRRADGGISLLVDSETDYNRDGKYNEEREQRTVIGEDYPDFSPGMLRVFDGVATFDSDPYTDRWGTWISAYHPLFDASGRQIGALGADFDAKQWVSAIATARLIVLIVWLGLLGIVVWTVAVLARLKREAEERGKILNELKGSRTQIEEITSQIAGAFIQFRTNQDGERQTLYVSAGIAGLCGLESWEVMKQPEGIFSLLETGSDARVNEELAAASVIRRDLSIDVQIRGPKGSPIWVRIHASPRSLNEEDVNWTGTMMEITAEKSMEQERVARQKQVEDMNALMVGRELKMIELKKRIQELEKNGGGGEAR